MKAKKTAKKPAKKAGPQFATRTKAAKKAKKPMRSLPPLPKSLDHPTLTLIVEFDEDHDLSGLLDTIQEIMDLARGDGEVISANLTNVPANLDCIMLDRRY